MRSFLGLFALLALLMILPACTSPGIGSAAATNVPQTQGAQTVGGDQGQASAAETGSATAQIAPTIINAIAAKKVTIGKNGTDMTVEIEGADDAEVVVTGSPLFGVHVGAEAGITAETSSGGGSAGGVGDAVRTGGSTTTGTAPPAAPVITQPAPAGGGGQ